MSSCCQDTPFRQLPPLSIQESSVLFQISVQKGKPQEGEAALAVGAGPEEKEEARASSLCGSRRALGFRVATDRSRVCFFTPLGFSMVAE